MKQKGGLLVKGRLLGLQFLALLERLAEKYVYSFRMKTDATHSAVRFCTSWASRESQVLELIADIEKA